MTFFEILCCLLSFGDAEANVVLLKASTGNDMALRALQSRRPLPTFDDFAVEGRTLEDFVERVSGLFFYARDVRLSREHFYCANS